MTSTTISPSNTTIRALPAALATLLGTVAFTALGVFGDGTDGHEHNPLEFFVIAGFAAVVVGLVFGLCVPRLERSSKAGAVGLALSVVGLLAVAVFWAGITPAMAVGGLLLGAAARRSGRSPGLGSAAMAVGALAILGYVASYVADWMATNNIAGM